MDREPDFRVSITQDHINRGVRSAYDCCPLALALLDSGYCSVRVDKDEACVSGVSMDDHFFTHDGGDFVTAFDWHEHVSPREVSFWKDC